MGTPITTAPKTLTGDTVTYRPEPGFTGRDSVNFKVNDGAADSDIATVTVLVTEPPNAVPVAFDDAVETTVGTPVPIVLAAEDVDGDSLIYTLTSLPQNGDLFEAATRIDSIPHTLVGDTVLYIPTAGFSGADKFQFKVNDGRVDSAVATVSIDVSPVPPQTYAVRGTVLLEGMDDTISGAWLSFSNGGEPTRVVSDPTDGSFQVQLVPGTYTVTAEKDGFLKATTEVLVVSQDVALPTVTLLGGDTWKNGVIDVGDLVVPAKNQGNTESHWSTVEAGQ